MEDTMYQAAAASSIPNLPANPFRRLFDRLTGDRPLTADCTMEISLVQRRLVALRGSAPTWHPLHLQRTVTRTVVEPLRSILPQLRGSAARQVAAAIAALVGVDISDISIEDLDRAALLLVGPAGERRGA
jgi:hypothetical protein